MQNLDLAVLAAAVRLYASRSSARRTHSLLIRCLSISRRQKIRKYIVVPAYRSLNKFTYSLPQLCFF